MIKLTGQGSALAAGGLIILAAACDQAPTSTERDAALPEPDSGTAELVDAGAPESEDSGADIDWASCEDGELPQDLFCTGLYAKRDARQFAKSAVPYKPGVTLWSDGAEKQRFLYVPENAQIETSNMDAWRFPVGTKAWKEFRVDGALVETRLLWKRSADKWESATYLWDSAGQSATLNTNSKGTILASGYEIPAARDCDKCHHGASDKLLGVEALALALPTAEGRDLSALAASGLLTHVPEPLRVELPEDGTGKAGAALGYLHANCGMPCHSSRGLGEETQLVLRLRADEFWPAAADRDAGAATGDAGARSVPARVAETDIYHATVGQHPTTASVIQAYPTALRITPGVHDQSLIWLLSHLRGKYQMPPLVSHRVDDVSMQQLADWIDALPNASSP